MLFGCYLTECHCHYEETKRVVFMISKIIETLSVKKEKIHRVLENSLELLHSDKGILRVGENLRS